MTDFIKLYKVHSTGKVGYWTCEVTPMTPPHSDAKMLVTSAASEDAKPVSTVTYIQGKNIGKSNETSPFEQACLELVSKANKKRDKGYVDDKPEAGASVTNTLGFTLPQKAMQLDKVKVEKIDWNTAWVQPKIDGHRAMVKDGVMYSSSGKPITTLPQFKSIPTGIHLDGELYIHGKTLTEIGKLIKKYRPGESEKVEYHVFDSVSERNFPVRFADTMAWQSYARLPQLVDVPTFAVDSMEQVMAFHKRFLAEGYEGTMIRQGDNPYKGGSRCMDIIKIKDMQDAEYRIVGVGQGKPVTAKDGTEYQVAIFSCLASNGSPFDVLSHGTREEKHQHWLNRDSAVGKMLTVQSFGLTDYGIPNLPVAKCFREDL
mgnify:CR=1 FL=1|jgi:DNA ligase-1